MNIRHQIVALRLCVAGISLIVVFCAGWPAIAIQTFESASITSEVNVDEAMQQYDPHLLRITFSAQPLAEPVENPEVPEMFAPTRPDVQSGAAFFDHQQASSEPPPSQSAPEAHTQAPIEPPMTAPEPSSLVLAVIGLAGLWLWLSQRRSG